MNKIKFNRWTVLASIVTAFCLLILYTTYLGGVFYISRIALIILIPTPFWYLASYKSRDK